MTEIRAGRPQDARRLTEVAHAAKRHWGYPGELMALWREALTVTGEFIDENPIFCAMDDEEITGFYALSHEDDVFELEHMWIDPTRHGSGIGALLFAHAVDVVRSLGGTRLNIASDPNAVGFYERMGAVRTGEVPSRPEGRTLPLLTLVIESSDAAST